MARPQLITFDCYGTLIDWNAGIVGAFQEEAERQGREADAVSILSAYHEAEPAAQAEEYRPYREVLTLLESALAERLRWEPPEVPGYLAESLPSWPPFTDTNTGLERLRDAGCRLGILSNIDDDLLAGTLRHFTVEFNLLVTAQQLSSYKPAVAHFERALDGVGGERERLTHLAQSYFHDIRPAAGMGIRTVWVNRLSEARPAQGPAPDADVPDLTAAADWVVERLG